MNGKVAVIDLGSNSIRMIILKISENGAYRMIDQAKENVRLSEGMASTDKLGEPPMERALDTLRLFRKLVGSHKVDRVIAVATAAVRNASNAQDFLDRVLQNTGFEFTVASGEQESYYDYLGVVNSIDIADCLILDTGGGSTEIIQVEDRQIVNSISIPYGAVLLTERFFKGGDASKSDRKKAEEFLLDRIKEIPWLCNRRGTTIIGLGGSIRNLAKIHKRTKGMFLSGLHNFSIGAEETLAGIERIAELDAAGRKKLQGLGKDRADIIVGGLVPLKVLMNHTRAERLLISGYGLREGVFFEELHGEIGLESSVVDSVLDHSLLNTMRIYEANIPHATHVRELALEMFDQMKELHGLGASFRKLLSVGAQLHDIGLYVGYYNHHAHGFYLALNSEINGLTHRELLLSAFIIALHRNEPFDRNWAEFNLYMNEADYTAVQKLGLLVRIAEGLDRNEYGYVEGIRCRVGKERVDMLLKTRHIADLEIETARLSTRTFRKLFGRTLRIGYE